jgi:ATP-dependent DNA ligase
MISLDMKPMAAAEVESLPMGNHWVFEPKYDGLRCLAFRNGDQVNLQSQNQRALERYFPEIVEAMHALPADQFVLDGELIIPGRPYEVLQSRLHPAGVVIAKLSRTFPAALIAFDLLVRDGESLLEAPFTERRAALEAFAARVGAPDVGAPSWLILSKTTLSKVAAMRWMTREACEGIVAKRLDLPYRPGLRAMKKYKRWKTVDCVVGGVSVHEKTGDMLSFLLGLYDKDGKLNYVGRLPLKQDVADLTPQLATLEDGEGFTGRPPGEASRWTAADGMLRTLKPRLVAEVKVDHITGNHFRRSARWVRWRDDKDPQDCTMDQMEEPPANQSTVNAPPV